MEYIYADIILFIPWLVFFLLRKDLRKEIVIMSLLAAPLGFFDLLFVPAYWKPITTFNIPVGIEGILFSFLIGGLAAVSYMEFVSKRLEKIKNFHRHFSVLVFSISLPVILIIQYFNLMNIELGLYLGLLIGTGAVVLVRKDLLRSSLFGGIVFGLIYSVGLIIWVSIFPSGKEWFVLAGLPKIFFLNAPIYEMIFAFLFGAYWGNLYELFFGYRFK